MTSIRARTAALVAGSIVSLLALGGAVLMVVVRAALIAQFDAGLAARSEALCSLTRFDGAEVEMEFAGETMPRFASDRARGAPAESAEYFVAWIREGEAWRVLERSESLSGERWPDDALRSAPSGPRDVVLPDGGTGRGMVVEFEPRDEPDEDGEHAGELAATEVRAGAPDPAPSAPRVRLLVALSREALDRTLAIVGWSIAGVGLGVACASVPIVRWAAGRGLAPLTDLSCRVRTLGPDSLDERFESDELPRELRPIAEQLSALLGRLHEAFARERRFTAAASHELRTPIAELRLLLEVARRRPRTSEAWHETSGRALEVLDRAQSLCEMLLRLSRADTSAGPSDPAPRADVRAVVDEHVLRALSLHGGDAALVNVACEPGLVAPIAPAALGVVLGNLLDNALAHGAATADDPVVVRAATEGGRTRIAVSNPAPELSDADLAHVFEPFWRRDDARGDRRGFGLGLSVARALVREAGGDLSARREPTGIIVFAVDL